MDDQQISQRISALMDEEHHLQRAHVGQALSPDEHARMSSLGEELDQCWDLLRQRRARRESGQDPDAAQSRAGRVVEGYQQ